MAGKTSESKTERTADEGLDSQKGFQLGFEEFSWNMLFHLKKTV